MSHTATLKDSHVIRHMPGFFGWSVVGAAVLGMAMTIPGQTAGVSVFIDAIIGDLGLSRQHVSLAYTIATLGGAAVLPLVGRGIDRYGPRAAVIVISVAFALTCFGMSLIGSLLGLFAGFVMLRALGPGSLSLVSLHVANLWFIRRRGLVVGLLGAGIALATATFPLLIDQLIAAVGWRFSFVIIALSFIGIMLPVGALFFRGKPELFGLQPDGTRGDKVSPGSITEPSYTLKQARHTYVFWLFTAAGVCMGALGTGLLFHHFAIMEVNGVGRTAATAVFVPLGLTTAGMNLCTGYLMDRLPPWTLLAVMLLFLCATLSVATYAGSLALVWLYGSTFGLAQGMQSAITGSVYAHYFGRNHLGAIKGFTKTIFVAGTAIGPFVFALGMDYVGTHATLYLLTLIPLLIAVVTVTSARRNRGFRLVE